VKNGELPERQPQLLRELPHPVYLFGKDLDCARAASLLAYQCETDEKIPRTI